MFKVCSAAALMSLLAGCGAMRNIPISNGSSTGLGGANFEITRTGLVGQASCIYLFGFIPLLDPAIATRAMDQLVESSGSSGKSSGLVNFAMDGYSAFYLAISIDTVKVRADVAEFKK